MSVPPLVGCQRLLRELEAAHGAEAVVEAVLLLEGSGLVRRASAGLLPGEALPYLRALAADPGNLPAVLAAGRLGGPPAVTALLASLAGAHREGPGRGA